MASTVGEDRPYVQTDLEADFRDYIQTKAKEPDRRSALIKARSNYPGEIINACPFDKNIAHLDKNQYCEHLVGFTDPEQGVNPKNLPTYYFPQTYRPDALGRVRMDRQTGRPTAPLFTDQFNPQPIIPGRHRLVLGTTCFRVYDTAPQIVVQRPQEDVMYLDQLPARTAEVVSVPAAETLNDVDDPALVSARTDFLTDDEE